MIRRIACWLLLVVLCLSVSTCAYALTITADPEETELGLLSSGSSVSLTLTATPEAENVNASSIKWTMKATSGTNPGLKLGGKAGTSVTLSAKSLSKPGKNGGSFAVEVTAQASNGEKGTLTISGTVLEAPAFKTTKLDKVQAGIDKKYLQKIELKAGSEPLTWELEGDLPTGFEFTEAVIGSKTYHVISGDCASLDEEAINEYPITITVTSASLDNAVPAVFSPTLIVEPLKPAIKLPKGFSKNFAVTLGEEFTIDLSSLDFTGTSPFTVDIDDDAKALGVTYDSDANTLTGTIESEPSKGKFPVTLKVSNAHTTRNSSKPATLPLTLNVKTPPNGLTVTGTTITSEGEGDDVAYTGSATVGKSFKAQFKANGGSKPIVWDYIVSEPTELAEQSIINDLGGKFQGLTFSNKGTVTGKPTNAQGQYAGITFSAVASNDAAQTTIENVTITFGKAPAFSKAATSIPRVLVNGGETPEEVSISLNDFLDTSAMTVYNGDSDEEGTVAITTYEINSKLPVGLTFENESEEPKISGTLAITDPKDVKKYSISITATNDFGTAKGKITLDVQAAPVIDPDNKLNNSILLTATMGKAYKLAIPTNTKKPYIWSLEDEEGKTIVSAIGSTGLTWNAAKGIITGTKTSIVAPVEPDDRTIKLKVTLANDVGTDEKELELVVEPAPLEITSPKVSKNSVAATLKPATVGKPYSVQVRAKGSGVLTWSLGDGDDDENVPSGFKIDGTGLITSIMNPRTMQESDLGEHTFAVNVADVYGQTASVTVRLMVNGTLPEEDDSGGDDDDDGGETSGDNSALPEDVSALPDGDSDTPSNTEELEIVRVRDIASLSVAELLVVSNDEYIPVAVLPEVRGLKSGLYDLDVILDDEAPTGARLYWFAFPQDADPSDDDDIAEYYTDEGEETEVVSESHNVTVSAWFNEGVTYAPVIAVKRVQE